MLTLPVRLQFPSNSHFTPLHSSFLPGRSSKEWCVVDAMVLRPKTTTVCVRVSTVRASSGPFKLVRDRSLDRHVVKSNKIRFIQKLKTLLLSKPKHFLPLKVIYKCRAYLALSKTHSILSMIHRYPTIFEFFTIPTPPTPLNATKPLSQLCVRLTPAAAALAVREYELKSKMSVLLAAKLQKLLMLSSHRRILLSKLVHIGPDLGLPVNFRSRLCNEFPDRFKVVDTSYGRALELVSWDSSLARPLPSLEVDSASLGLIVDRPLRFKHLGLRKGINLKRRHQDYLVKFNELPDVCPYRSKVKDFPKESIEAEKRACAVVREVLGMMVEKRTLVDHLTHFRKDFGLSNQLRAMLVRHPELFYVSLKGLRHSVFLVEGYDDGRLKEKDELLVIKDKFMQLVREGKQLRREKRKAYGKGKAIELITSADSNEEVDDDFDVSYDGLDDLFELDDLGSEDDTDKEEFGSEDDSGMEEESQFWTTEGVVLPGSGDGGGTASMPW
ncbi:PREDICTED: protein ROOT PRIMORDIUM DEFECTIVE 1 [Ipomoea nil]|uniref:protein ROOT PRIMORDIUM DEFECTIVE 1 n=1 Tax=Ipomoea nil TaxID=35883 RepID=UPI0009018BC8|nr:PREDICTED: protein ROOT PRIMORDIUM DEFECTIVE 1 [Ipomoea nil]